MPKYSPPPFRDSPDEEDALDLSDEMSGALDPDLDPEAAAFVASQTRRGSASRPARSSKKSGKDTPRSSQNASKARRTSEAPVRTRSGDAFSRRAARENSAWERELEAKARAARPTPARRLMFFRPRLGASNSRTPNHPQTESHSPHEDERVSSRPKCATQSRGAFCGASQNKHAFHVDF